VLAFMMLMKNKCSICCCAISCWSTLGSTQLYLSKRRLRRRRPLQNAGAAPPRVLHWDCVRQLPDLDKFLISIGKQPAYVDCTTKPGRCSSVMNLQCLFWLQLLSQFWFDCRIPVFVCSAHAIHMLSYNIFIVLCAADIFHWSSSSDKCSYSDDHATSYGLVLAVSYRYAAYILQHLLQNCIA
jgi:hypothetical protein